MSGTVPAHSAEFSLESAFKVHDTRAQGDRWQQLADTAILVLGSPRSGTTWLAKIFDSHPDILYRHEPDELTRADPGLNPAEQVAVWLRQRGLRAAAKRPNFPKSWRPAPLEHARKVFAGMLAAAQRMPAVSRAAEQIGVPDLVAFNRWSSVRAAVKLVNWDGSAAAQTMPDARCVFILRHPCGQIASLMAGVATRQFISVDQSAAPVDAAVASAWAARHGVDALAFNALPDAAKYAWGWLAFNEPALEALHDRPNARVLIYEDLCRQPEAVARDLFAFVGLNWHPQTTGFLGSSTQHDRPAGYYDVFRSTGMVSDRWRQTMSPEDQSAVRRVVAMSSLARCWPDLALSAA